MKFCCTCVPVSNANHGLESSTITFLSAVLSSIKSLGINIYFFGIMLKYF